MNDFAAPADFDRDDPDAPEVRNPKSSELVKRHPDWCSCEVPVAKAASKSYVVSPILCLKLRGHAFKAILAAMASSEPGRFFLWPIKPDNESMARAAEEAKTSWVRVKWQNSDKSYLTERPEDQPPEPTWPFADFPEMVDKAFGDRKIVDPDDPIIKKILGIKESRE